MRKPIAVICALMILVTLLAGCGSQEQSSKKSSKTVTTTAPATHPPTMAPATKPATTDSSSEKRRYNFLAIKQKSDLIYASLDDIIKENNYKGAVYLRLGNDLEFSQSAGSSDEVQRKRNSLHTCFYTGSITKHLTAAAVLKLSEDKKLSLDDTVDKYFDKCSFGKQVKIKDLLSMTSGIPSYTRFEPEETHHLVLVDEVDKLISEKNSEEKNKSAILKWILSQKTGGEPGQKYSYSDSDYFLLGKIIEKASKTSYTAYISENILKPLGMNNSGFRAPKSLASPYNDSADKKEKLTLEGVGYSALGFISNVSDTIRYIEGLFDESFINSDSLLAMHTAYKNGYGYGVQIDGDRISISSVIGAYSSTVTYSTDETELYVAYSNYSSSDSDTLNTLFTDYLSEFCF